MRIMLLGLAAMTLSACIGDPEAERPGPTQAAASCPTLSGADAVLAQSGKRFIIFGEMHGTAETPALFGDFVCIAACRGPVVVGLEMQEDQQVALDAYLASDGSPSARAALIANRHWVRGKDGRASEAMLLLVERLRRLKASGKDLGVMAFVRSVADRSSQTPYEKAMAGAWRESLEGRPNAKLVALVGNIHARRQKVFDLEPAVMHMPAESTVTIGSVSLGGAAWNCQREGCGPHPMGSGRTQIPRGIVSPPTAGNYDRLFSVGTPFTASPPAVAGVTP